MQKELAQTVSANCFCLGSGSGSGSEKGCLLDKGSFQNIHFLLELPENGEILETL